MKKRELRCPYMTCIVNAIIVDCVNPSEAPKLQAWILLLIPPVYGRR